MSYRGVCLNGYSPSFIARYDIPSSGLFEPFRQMVFGIEIIHQKANPASDQQQDDADGLASGADVHLEDFEDGLDAKDNADDVDDCCDHDDKFLLVDN